MFSSGNSLNLTNACPTELDLGEQNVVSGPQRQVPARITGHRSRAHLVSARRSELEVRQRGRPEYGRNGPCGCAFALDGPGVRPEQQPNGQWRQRADAG